MNKVFIAIMSHNRGTYLKNLIKSIDENFPNQEIRIYDDQSDCKRTLEVLAELSSKYKIKKANELNSQDQVQHLGGLWKNMSTALVDADNEGYERIFYVQDDCQFVRPVTPELLDRFEKIFDSKPKIVQILPLFFKGFLPELHSKYVIDRELQCYFDPAYGICDLGITHVKRLTSVGFKFSTSETVNSKRAKEEYGFQLAIARDPIMMYTPWPETMRSNSSFAVKILTKLNHWGVGAGVNPFLPMSSDEIQKLERRPIEDFPIAEHYLKTQKRLLKPWWYSSVFDTSKVKQLSQLLTGRWVWDGPQDYQRLRARVRKTRGK